MGSPAKSADANRFDLNCIKNKYRVLYDEIILMELRQELFNIIWFSMYIFFVIIRPANPLYPYPPAPGVYPPHMPPPPRPQMPQHPQQQMRQPMPTMQQQAPPQYRQQMQPRPQLSPRQSVPGPRGPMQRQPVPRQAVNARQRAPMMRPRGGMAIRSPRPRMTVPQNGQMMQNSPGQKVVVKRTAEQIQAMQIKRKRMDLLVPDKHDDADCQVIAVQPKNTGLPQIQSIQVRFPHTLNKIKTCIYFYNSVFLFRAFSLINSY